MAIPYAEVIGDPIAHSKSPIIHKFWLAKRGIEGDYRRCHVHAERLAKYFAQRRGDPAWRGCNITIPHKGAVVALVDQLDSGAIPVGAVNTVIPHGGALMGYNSDVGGVLAALPPSAMPPGAEVCLIGTGGAARSALAACQAREVALVLFSARDEAAARRLQEEFRFEGCVRPIEDRHNFRTVEVIINATPLGMVDKPPMPQAVLDHLAGALPGATVFDMVYVPLETPLLATARASGLRTVDGLEMLIGQAAAAFELFFGVPAPREHDAELRALLTA